MDDKFCTDCGLLLPAADYYFVSKASGRLRGQCKACMRQRKLEQREPGRTPACCRCGARLAHRSGSGRRLCSACFDLTYDTRHQRADGGHRIRLKPCSLCGGPKERFERGKVCVPCRPWLRYAASFRRFELTPAEYLALFEAQDGRCYICRALPGSVRLCIDHDHSVTPIRQAIRGLLCDDCNYSRLPRFADDEAMLRRAAEYLRRRPAQRVLAAGRVDRPAPPPPDGLIVSVPDGLIVSVEPAACDASTEEPLSPRRVRRSNRPGAAEMRGRAAGCTTRGVVRVRLAALIAQRDRDLLPDS